MAQQLRSARSVGARDGHEGPVVAQPGPHPTSESAPTLSERRAGRQRPGPWTPTVPMDAKSASTGTLENREERGFPQRPQPRSSSSSRSTRRDRCPGPAPTSVEEFVSSRWLLTIQVPGTRRTLDILGATSVGDAVLVAIEVKRRPPARNGGRNPLARARTSPRPGPSSNRGSSQPENRRCCSVRR